MGRVLLVSNRLPITVSAASGSLTVERSAGGLATGLASVHARSGGTWFGWPGDVESLGPAREELEPLLRSRRLRAVPLTQEEARRYYENFSNGVLWPVFHYLIDQLPLEIQDQDLYEQVNIRFADAVAAEWQPGDVVWVHDYQLLRVPALLRERVPDARIGFFLHIPFPAADVFRVLPRRAEFLEGMLGADLVGFHTASYLRHFASSVLRVLGVSVDVDRVRIGGRDVRLGVFPMGVDAAAFSGRAEGSEVDARVRELRGAAGTRTLVGIDRLDYTKGIPRRLLAFERLLERHPELHEKAKLVQVAVPSRTNVDAYQDFRSEVDRLTGRINGKFATPSWTPVHYLYRGISEQEVVDLYRAADVMLVTPLRDGMNLVAKEFVASRTDDSGVLVLSEFAGAANELSGAILVNPYDVDGVAESLVRALTMPDAEQKERMRGLREIVARHDVEHWASTFLGVLTAPDPDGRSRMNQAAAGTQLRDRIRTSPETVLLLDYDGTLVPFEDVPERAVPDDELRKLLIALSSRPGVSVHVVSGRTRENLDEMLGKLPVWLHAEHGLWSRVVGGDWTSLPLGDISWRERVLPILEEFADRTPRAWVERKAAGFSWHYRASDPEFGPSQARELLLHLAQVLTNLPVEVLAGNKIVEVRPHGVHKGRVVAPLAARDPGAVFVAVGDDRTDDDLFAALPPGSVRVRVGQRHGDAELNLAEPHAVRAWLWSLT